MADENENGQEKTEDPTSKKLNESRDKGQVARSRELTTMMLLISAGVSMFMFGGEMGNQMLQIMRNGLTPPRTTMLTTDMALPHLGSILLAAGEMLLPLFGVLVIVAALAPMALGGFSFSLDALGPKFEKMNPIKGIGRMFSINGLIELLKSLAKFVLIGSIAVGLLSFHSKEFIGLGTQDVSQALPYMGSILSSSFLVLCSGLVLIAAIDVPYQLWNHSKQLRMTLQEVKDEMKETDGRPEVKARIRQLQREMAQGRMLEAVPDADVVITNPTHFAVALKYDTDGDGAPRVVAKGSDLVAARIRSLATGADVPLFAAPPLARALFYSTDIDREVPEGLYLAVAQVLAYVFQIKSIKVQGGDEPLKPADLPVPDEFLVKDKYRNRAVNAEGSDTAPQGNGDQS